MLRCLQIWRFDIWPRGVKLMNKAMRVTWIYLACAISALIAIAGLVGYIPGLTILGSYGLGYIPMAPSTARALSAVPLPSSPIATVRPRNEVALANPESLRTTNWTTSGYSDATTRNRGKARPANWP